MGKFLTLENGKHKLENVNSLQIYNSNSTNSLQIDFSQAENYKILLTDNCEFSFLNPVGGRTYTLILKQDATGNRSITFPGNVKIKAGNTLNLSYNPNEMDWMTLYYDDQDNIFICEILRGYRKLLIGYTNVFYEEYKYFYFIPSLNSHFTQASGVSGGAYVHLPISPYELFDTSVWVTNGFMASTSYPNGNPWGRYSNWASTGNLGFKTLAEYNDLLSQMDNTSKRNLTGVEVYQ